ncbi:hypothetical protein NK718_08780 [Alsobacter sp. SYSU M60028]|uniref:Uncharacterized protein n=1 Tax=Alsobacter ponti TaxID=2962936 RepID=A0ABT1LAV0_9HYPH|nr:hypothetical protein [Alsobacter ponti]MCP8938605.1 hypothetical protein [Alsobacter ponti]
MRPGSLSAAWSRNPALRLVVTQAGLGAALGFAFALSIVALDVHGVGRLMLRSDSGLVAFALMAGGFMVTFGSLVAGGAIMLVGARDDEGRPRRGRVVGLIPARVHARARRARRP